MSRTIRATPRKSKEYTYAPRYMSWDAHEWEHGCHKAAQVYRRYLNRMLRHYQNREAKNEAQS